MPKRYERQYGVNQQLLGMPSGEAEAQRGIQQALSGFTSTMGASALDAFGRKSVGDAKDQAAQYDPASGAPVLSTRQNKAGEIYNRQVLEAHQQDIDYSLRTKITALSSEYENDPKSFAAASEVYLNQAANEMHPSIAKEMMPKYGYYRDATLSKLSNAERKRVLKQTRETADKWFNQNNEDIARTFRSGDFEEGIEQASLFIEQVQNSSHYLDQEKVELLATVARTQYGETFVRAHADADPIEALTNLESVRNEVPDIFTTEQWDDLIASETTRQNARISIDKKQEAERNEVLGAEAANLGVEINRLDANVSDDSVISIQDSLNQLRTQGYSDSGWATLQKQLDNKIKAIGIDADEMNQYNAAIGSDSDVYMGDINKVWKQVSANLEGDPNRADKILNIIDKTKQVPDELMKETRRGMLSGDPKTLIASADMALRINASGYSNGFKELFNEQEVAYAQHLKDGLNHLSAPDAIARANELARPKDRARAESRAALFKEENKKTDWDTEAKIDFGGWFSPDIDNLNAPALASDYERITKSYFQAGLDLGASKEKASEDINRLWGDFDGRLVKYPPNKFYTIPKTDPKWIKEQLIEDTKHMGFDQVFLAGDDRTSREQFPSYLVYGLTPEGLTVLPQRFQPEIMREVDRMSAETEAYLSSDDILAGRMNAEESQAMSRSGPNKFRDDPSLILLPKVAQEAIANTFGQMVQQMVITPVKVLGGAIKSFPVKANLSARYAKANAGRQPSKQELNAMYKQYKRKEAEAPYWELEDGTYVDDNDVMFVIIDGNILE